MYRATTPTHTFILPFNTNLIDSCFLTYEQLGQKILELDEDDLTFSGNNIIATLTQQQTKLFTVPKKFPNAQAQAMLHIKLTTGAVINSNVINIPVNEVFHDEVM